jgi:hypothetical protein
MAGKVGTSFPSDIATKKDLPCSGYHTRHAQHQIGKPAGGIAARLRTCPEPSLPIGRQPM